MSSIPFAARLAAVMVAVVLAASSLTVSLNYLKFRRVLRFQEDLAYQVVVDDLAGTLEDGISLGIALGALQATEQLIQRRRSADKNTFGITVFGTGGTVLFDTDQYRVGAAVPADWRPPASDVAKWQAETGAGNVVGTRIANSFSQTAGGVILRYDPGPLEARIRAVLLDMVRASLGMLLVAIFVAAAAAAALTWPLRRWLAWAGRDLMRRDGTPESASAASLSGTVHEMQATEEALMALGLGETQVEKSLVG